MNSTVYKTITFISIFRFIYRLVSIDGSFNVSGECDALALMEFSAKILTTWRGIRTFLHGRIFCIFCIKSTAWIEIAHAWAWGCVHYFQPLDSEAVRFHQAVKSESNTRTYLIKCSQPERINQKFYGRCIVIAQLFRFVFAFFYSQTAHIICNCSLLPFSKRFFTSTKSFNKTESLAATPATHPHTHIQTQTQTQTHRNKWQMTNR